jgi:hypothetical protein
MDPASLSALFDAAIAAIDGLADLGESIDDEWSYVNDLRQAWTDRLAEAGSGPAGAQPADPAVVAAVESAIDEAARISDPHRAIDWLSTLPQVVLLAAGFEA